MSNFKGMVFKLDLDNREAEGQLVERYLTALGYKDEVEWNAVHRTVEKCIYIHTEINGTYSYYSHLEGVGVDTPIPTPYQVAVAEHMATAPQPLAEYVRGRLVESDVWRNGDSPVFACGFPWFSSVEGEGFWDCINTQRWKKAMATDFWRNRTAPSEATSEAPSVESGNTGQPLEEYDFVNPKHYQEFSVEVIDMMAAIWGKETTALHCEMCAFKYRLRIGSKPNQSIEDELGKIKWYMEKAKELRDA